MQFPTKLYLQDRFLPRHYAAVERYATLLNRMGLNINKSHGKWNAGSLHADVVLPQLDDLARCVLALVDTQ